MYRPIKFFVPQRSDYDCTIATIAMWTRLEYDQVELVALKNGWSRTSGLLSGIQDKVLRDLGILPYTLFNNWTGVPGLLSVPSLNVEGGAHAVYFDGQHIIDPQRGRSGKKAYGAQLKGLWPGCCRITVDLREEHSMFVAQMEYKQMRSRLVEAGVKVEETIQ
ncbi:MAG: hypothetical protein ACJ76H_14775 [Bacteriovoracaceae bacterium]|jgi:hypothetical protein